jgi:hypothetical protein
MKRFKIIHLVHLLILSFLVFGFIAVNTTGGDEVATLVLNFLLGMLTLSYIGAILWVSLPEG